jgi:VWFA-related protein
MRTWVTLLLVGSMAAAPSQRTSSADPQPTFRVGTKLVEVDVVARDKRGPATGLTRDDFTLLDNGKPRDIAFFSVRSVRGSVKATPLSTAPTAARLLAPGWISNRPNRDEAPATQTVLLLDRLFTQPTSQAYAIQRIITFLDRRRKQDGIGIYTIGTRLQVLQDVTDNDALLRRAANHLKAGKPDSRDLDITGMTEHAAEEYLSLQERIPVLAIKHAFQAIARHLANVPGRKNLVWITEGFPLFKWPDDYRPDMEEAARTLNDANVALYAVDARGLIGALGEMTGIPPAESRGIAGPQLALAMRNRAYGPAGPAHIETMNLLASVTGGDVYFNTNGLEDSFKKAVEDGDVTYSLGFYPSDTAHYGKVHKLSVKVAKAGMGLRYRETYFAAKPQTEAENRPSLLQLLKDPLNATQIGLLGRATADPAHSGAFDVQVSVDLHDIQLGNQDGKWVGSIEVSFHVENAKSAQVITRPIEILEDQLATALERGIVIHHSIEWQGETGDVRVVVEDKTSGAAGSLQIPLGKN